MDTTEAVVVVDDDDEFQALLHGGDDLGVQHQVAAVAEKREDLAARVGEFHAERSGDFVAHARVAVFGVVVVGRVRTPEFVDVAGDAARSVDGGAGGAAGGVHGVDDLRLGEAGCIAARGNEGGARRGPRGAHAGDLRAVGG